MEGLLIVYVQRRGTNNEVQHSLRFSSLPEAESAAEQLEKDYQDAEPDSHLIIKSSFGRLSILKQDYRRNQVIARQESRPGGSVA